MILSSIGDKLLIGAGIISYDKVMEKARTEYKKYQVKIISPVERECLDTIKQLNNKIKKNNKK